MMNLYEIGLDGQWTGAVCEVEDTAPIGQSWTTETPPELAEGESAVWSVDSWTVAVIVPARGSGAAPGDADAGKDKRDAYRERADPVFFKWQRGEATEQDWLDAIATVKAEFG